MTPEAIQIAVAEEMGYKRIGLVELEFTYELCGDLPPTRGWTKVPDYPIDLNACMSLCDALAKEGWNCDCRNGLDTTWECEFTRESAHGTSLSFYGAATTLSGAICESFLRVRGKWVES